MDKMTPQILGMYIGQKCMRPDGVTVLSIDGIHGNSVLHNEQHGTTYSDILKCKPILRRLSSMTEEEMKDIFLMIFDSIWHDKPEVFHEGVRYEFLTNDHGEIGFKVSCDSSEDKYGLTIEENTGVYFSMNGDRMNCNQFKLTAHLASLDFDLFGLIDAGLALASEKGEDNV